MSQPQPKTVLSLDLEPRPDVPPFRAPECFPRGTSLTVVKAVRDGVPGSAAPFSHIVLSGSSESITQYHPTMAPAMALIRDAVARGVPVMGVCYGHQLIVRALLGPAHIRRAVDPEFGWLPIHTNPRGAAWFDGLPNPFRVFVGHYDEVVDLPSDWEVLAHTDRCGVHAVVNADLRVLGVQFHPEMDLATGNACFALDESALAASDVDARHIIATAADDGSGDILFPRFLAWRWS